MKRRSFVKNSALSLGAIPVVSNPFSKEEKQTKSKSFNMKFGPHTGMFKHHAGTDPIDELKFMADQGFSAFEDNWMSKRDVALQEKMGKEMDRLGITMGVFVAHKIYWKEANLASGDEAYLTEFLGYIKEAVDVSKRCNAKWMTVVPGHLDLGKMMGYQTANVVDALKRACEILEPHELTMVLEPLNFRDHPGLFLSKSPQAYEICKAVDSPSCKILFDIYHQQIQEGNLIPNIEACWNEIAYFQIGDNPGRKEPTTGEINYKNVFQMIHDKGFRGVMGMEHGNSRDGKEGELAVIQAYREVDAT